ncbi:MAG: DUF1552 domain-containing protein [Polyangiaceae bacterium]|nr:DUF1552 domain-containing protein [Polyangiaceae bacterium]
MKNRPSGRAEARGRGGWTRRRWLRGAFSTALALPALEIFRETPVASAATQPPRLLVYTLPNGRRPEWWVPAFDGATLTFPGQSSALQPFASRALSLVGLDNSAARNSPGAAHAMGNGTILTGTTIPDLVGLKNNISIDQIIANEINPPTRFKSLQWSAGEPGPCDVGGASCAYTQSCSWAGPGDPLIPTIDPVAAFDRLFRSNVDGLSGPAGEVRKRSLGSVLDYVDDDATRLEARLGSDDKQRLEEYFTALRELEKSLTFEGPACEVPLEGPAAHLSYPDRVVAFHQLIKLALQCDQTRIMTFMIEFGLSGRSHDFIGAPGGHHAISHYTNTDQLSQLERLETWHAQQVAGLLQLLADTPGAGGDSLLDETIVLVLPDMGAGSSHDHGQNCPLLLGGKGVINATGRQIAPGGPLTNLHVTLLDIFGIEGQFGAGGAIFGDNGTAEIAGIRV